MAESFEKLVLYENEEDSDDDITTENHNLSSIYTKKRVDDATYSGTTFLEDEDIQASHLVRKLKEQASHRLAAKKWNSVQSKTKKVSTRQLERTEEIKILRELAYQNVKKDLDQWQPVVERMKLAPQLNFPLIDQKLQNKPSTMIKEPTELEIAYEKVIKSSKGLQEQIVHEEKESGCSMAEMIEMRKMTAKMRARESYRIAAAVRRNKIKSKRYHRFLKKDRAKKELEEFEKLKKTDPEAVLEKLEKIERTRAEERISLRHKGAGKWAKNKAIRAKYDTQARMELAEQLAKGRELTRKVRIEGSSNSEDSTDNEQLDDDDNSGSDSVLKNNDGNLWIPDFSKYTSGFNKFLKNKSNEVGDEEDKPLEKLAEGKDLSHEEEIFNVKSGKDNSVIEEDQSEEKIFNVESDKDNSDMGEDQSEEDDVREKINKIQTKSINEMFDEAENILQRTTSARVEKLKLDLNERVDDSEDEEINKKEKVPRINFRQNAKLSDIDNALIEMADEGISSGLTFPSLLSKNYNKVNTEEKIDSAEKVDTEEKIDQDNFFAPKAKKLNSELPDLDENGDSDEDDDENRTNLDMIAAFEEDNIKEFMKDKKEESKSSAAKTISLGMRGWNSWAGPGISEKPKKKNRKLVRVLPGCVRKDQKKPRVWINEEINPNLRKQMVSELPYPFTSVRDYEASIRAPLGRHWNTDQSFKKNIQPAVITKAGKIIEPIKTSSLPKKSRKRPMNHKSQAQSKKMKLDE